MVFTKRLREGVVRGEITCSIRIWTSPHVKVGNRYRMGDGEIEIESIAQIGFPDITPALALESGFLGVLDLLKVAKHGKGDNIYLIPDGSEWFLVDQQMLLDLTEELKAVQVDPLKTTIVQDYRCMTTWVLRKRRG